MHVPKRLTRLVGDRDRDPARIRIVVLLACVLALESADLSTSGSQQHVSAATTQALQETFLIMLVPLALNGLMLLGARRRYPADVATAIASERSGGSAKRGSANRARRRRKPAGPAASPARTAG